MTVVCGQAAFNRARCCWPPCESEQTHLVLVDYGSEKCEHGVCDEHADRARSGWLPEQHSDGVVESVVKP